MISFIVFGVIAIIAITLLLTFNIRAFSRTETLQDRHTEATAGQDNSQDEKEKTLLENQKELISTDEPTATDIEYDPKPNPKNIHLAQMSDQQYRNTLRQYLDEKKESPTPSRRHGDEDYRSALRSMRTPKG
ncbi:hypothetical protein Desaci_3245 [Desulfosporosinus acidiphilus SJ4]|uniref:Uncharacterized protein n=1 Tax=Desulfosporosinus acidiphilus (strain DSM 22704 / JCM 16185 / SJ4) TaxID=646529 RepID=I4D8L8_DESAJ|nr:hypothetical protein [Desulfosporosinus acidiphilus]AFM42142.1 hypothetical protein Desaci_3245 [Desulfosporosinus acidiphilus SJ4]